MRLFPNIILISLPDLKKFLQLKPYAATGYNDIGWTYRELGQFAEARTNLDRAIEIEPDYARARNNRSILFAAQKEWDDAIGSNEQQALRQRLGEAK